MFASENHKPFCLRCEGDGSLSVLADCTTMGLDCACNGPRVVIDPCPSCNGTGSAVDVNDVSCGACGAESGEPCHLIAAWDPPFGPCDRQAAQAAALSRSAA